MASKVRNGKAKPNLADDIRASLQGARDYFAGKPTPAAVHRVIPSAAAAREARIKLGLSARGEDVIPSRRGSKHGRIA
ncbi:MAG TPA: hypothetical protein VFA80_05125 [Xanthobacteraceae bacterium]|jgi:hypothetical protein|nr:hypothetical protein [Xanthobacteraceae bacterium]